MSTSHPPLLERAVGIAARLILRRFLRQARATVPRLADGDDVEALHDFRVAIRRTRSAARSWHDVLSPDIKRRHIKALARLQRATGEGRDAEVMLAWLSEQRGALSAGETEGAEWLSEVLAARKDSAYAHARGEVAGSLVALCDRALARLDTMEIPVEVTPQPPVSLSHALIHRAQSQVGVLAARLRSVTGVDDDETLHAARIECKRLRYLLEPVSHERADLANVVKLCKRLQTALGRIQDASVLRAELSACISEISAASPMDPRLPGLKALETLNEGRKNSVYGQVRDEWLGSALDTLLGTVEALRPGAEMELELEIERKYLLDGLPPEARRGRQKFIDQGYLPGTKLIERVRRIKKNEGERYVRTVKVGKGLTRIELEEETDRETFTALWALTKGCRVSKTRYTVTEGDFVWEIDDFADRNLVLAEVELPTAETAVSIPEWLEPYLVREVTDEGGYTNWKLAR